MLEVLRRIVQEVALAQDLEQALGVIVVRVKEAMGVDVCSVYLADEAQQQHVLMATDGLNPAAVGRVRLNFGEGLVSLVSERAEPVNLDRAPDHDRYRLIVETDEQLYYAFMGVPIIHHRKVLGVLIVQQQAKRRFGEDEDAFLQTVAAQLAGAIAHAELSGDIANLFGGGVGGVALSGLAGAPGVAIGTALVVYPQADLEAVPDRKVEDIEAEVLIFRQAVAAAQSDIRELQERLSNTLSPEDQVLFDAYLQMLGSASIVDQTIALIRQGSWASGALRDTIGRHVRVFETMDDPYMRERAKDVGDMGRRILMCLQKGRHKPPPYPERTILVGEEVTSTMLAEVPPERLVAVVSGRGSSSSHVAILARAMGIPAIIGLQNLPCTRIEGQMMIADGYSGRVYVAPSLSIRHEYERLLQEETELSAGLEELRELPAETPDGYRFPLYANTGLVSDMNPSLMSGAEGIGLYRTEFPFMARDSFPTEDEQERIYRKVVESFSPKPVVLRTLDIGGDKSLPYFPIEEENPFLGWRGMRITLDHPEIFLVQLRAMLRASSGYNNLRLLLPMISTVGELDDALVLVRQAYRELLGEGVDLVKPTVGVMVEVPSLVYQIDAVAKRVDFISVGTNDLTQYLLAVDRNNSRVAGLYDSLSPALILALKAVLEGARRQGIPVGVCGEMAGDPAAVLVLMGLNIDSLSMSVSSLARIKWVVRNFTRAKARLLLEQALKLENAQEVRAHLVRALEQAGLGGLVRAGK